MASTIVGLFDNWNEAHAAVKDLVDSGFRREDISVTSNDAAGEYQHFGNADRTADTGGATAAGAGIGAVLGGLGGLLVGLGALAIPGIGPIIALGPIATTLAGAGIGAVAGGLVGALTHMGVPEEEAGYYAEGVRRGGTLVTLTAEDGMTDNAADIMNRHGAVDIDRRAAAWREHGWTGYNPNAKPYTREEIDRERDTWRTGANAAGTDALRDKGQIRVPETEETIDVGKRAVQKGGVRVYKRVEEKPVRENVTLRDENVTVDRRPVDRPASVADQEAFRERNFEVRETAEVPVVNKEARVKEEVVIGKDVNTRQHEVRDTVRNTEVEVEKIPGRTTTMRDDEDL